MEGILWEITHLKQELDAIDEELDTHIRKTKDIESKILRSSEVVKSFTEEEESCKVATILQENRLQFLTIVSEKSHGYLLQERRNIQDVEDAIKHTTSKIRKEREEFMSCCNLFQKHVESTALERQRLLLDKNTLHEQIAKLSSLMDATEASRLLVFQERTIYLEQLTCDNKGLCALLQESSATNEKSMEETECHKNALKEVQAINEQMSGEIQENEEAIRQLKDLVMGLQIQLSHLIDQSL